MRAPSREKRERRKKVLRISPPINWHSRARGREAQGGRPRGPAAEPASGKIVT